MIRIDAKDLLRGAERFSLAAIASDAAISGGLKAVGKKYTEELQGLILRDEVRPSKRSGNGPTLYDSGKYARSFQTEMTGPASLVVSAVGQNDRMSNAALGELLEYGSAAQPARPHIRIVDSRMVRTGFGVLRKAFEDELRKYT